MLAMVLLVIIFSKMQPIAAVLCVNFQHQNIEISLAFCVKVGAKGNKKGVAGVVTHPEKVCRFES